MSKIMKKYRSINQIRLDYGSSFKIVDRDKKKTIIEILGTEGMPSDVVMSEYNRMREEAKALEVSKVREFYHGNAQIESLAAAAIQVHYVLQKGKPANIFSTIYRSFLAERFRYLVVTTCEDHTWPDYLASALSGAEVKRTKLRIRHKLIRLKTDQAYQIFQKEADARFKALNPTEFPDSPPIIHIAGNALIFVPEVGDTIKMKMLGREPIDMKLTKVEMVSDPETGNIMLKFSAKSVEKEPITGAYQSLNDVAVSPLRFSHIPQTTVDQNFHIAQGLYVTITAPDTKGSFLNYATIELPVQQAGRSIRQGQAFEPRVVTLQVNTGTDTPKILKDLKNIGTRMSCRKRILIMLYADHDKSIFRMWMEDTKFFTDFQGPSAEDKTLRYTETLLGKKFAKWVVEKAVEKLIEEGMITIQGSTDGSKKAIGIAITYKGTQLVESIIKNKPK